MSQLSARKGLLHYWPLDEASGSTVTDAINGQVGEVVFDTAGDTIVAGWIGSGRDLAIPPETYSYIKLYTGAQDLSATLQEWAIGIAFNHQDAETDWLPELFRIGYEQEGVTIALLYLATGAVKDTLYLEVYPADWPTSPSAIITHDAAVGSLVAGQHYAIVACNGTRIDLMLDGVLVGSVSRAAALQTKLTDFNVGGGGDFGAFGGVVDEITIWNRYVNVTEAAALWNGGTGVTALAYVESLEALDVAPPADVFLPKFSGYPKSVDFGLLVALAEGGEPVPEVEYTFGGRREFFADPPPWYARPGAIPEEEGE